MVEDGMRLQLNIVNKDFTIINQLGNGIIMRSMDAYAIDTLNHVEVIDNLRNLIDSLANAKVRKKSALGVKEECAGVAIVELQHCKVSFTTSEGAAVLEDNLLTCRGKFNTDAVINALSSTIEVLGKHTSNHINPRTSSVREVVDLNLLALKGNGNVLLVCKDNVYGNALQEVLFNRVYMPFIYVDIHKDEGVVYLYNGALNEVCKLPYDTSFDAYFEPDDNAFEMEG